MAQFNVRATAEQSRRWKMAAEREGFSSVGSWAAGALDAYLEHRTRAGRPVSLAWHSGSVRVALEEQEVTLRGWVSPPFGIFRGTAEGPLYRGCHRYTLTHLPSRRIIATLSSHRQCKALASELAPLLIRDEQAGASVVERHAREQA